MAACTARALAWGPLCRDNPIRNGEREGDRGRPSVTSRHRSSARRRGQQSRILQHLDTTASGIHGYVCTPAPAPTPSRCSYMTGAMLAASGLPTVLHKAQCMLFTLSLAAASVPDFLPLHLVPSSMAVCCVVLSTAPRFDADNESYSHNKVTHYCQCIRCASHLLPHPGARFVPPIGTHKSRRESGGQLSLKFLILISEKHAT
jgi:hypothetical protein